MCICVNVNVRAICKRTYNAGTQFSTEKNEQHKYIRNAVHNCNTESKHMRITQQKCRGHRMLGQQARSRQPKKSEIDGMQQILPSPVQKYEKQHTDPKLDTHTYTFKYK